MTWYNTRGSNDDVVLSTRIRLARNIADYPFMSMCDRESAEKIIESVTNALGADYRSVDFSKLSDTQARAYVEEHLVSPEFACANMPRSLLLNEEKGIAVMVCEEDHVRLQCILSGMNTDEAYKNACEADDILSQKLNIAWDEKLGYLTQCPTNLGTGMRVSLMMFLPALTEARRIGQLSASLSKLGLTIRGLYGEGSDASGCLYQVSNQITLGISEEDTIKKLNEVAVQIIEAERKLRSVMKSNSHDALCDRVMRAYGTMKNAYLMSTGEFMELFSSVRLGIALGMLDKISYDKLGDVAIRIQPSVLTVNAGHSLGESERDRARADLLRKELNG